MMSAVSDNGQMVGRLGSIDSGKFLIAEILKPIRTLEEIFALLGFYFTGRSAWNVMKTAARFLKLYSFIPVTLPFQTGYRIKYGTFAIVSNVAEGLSTEIALALANRGLNLILFGVNPEYLFKLEQRLRIEKSVHCILVVTTAHHTFLINDVMRIVARYDVGILINYFGDIDSTDHYYGNCNPQEEWEQIPKSVGKTMMLARFVLPGMYSRGRGVIVNVLPKRMVPTQQMIPYSVTAMACMSFIQALGESIRTSYSFRGLKVQTFTPFMDAIIKTPQEEALSKTSLVNLQPTMTNYAKSLVCTIGETDNSHGHWLHSLYYGLNQYLPQFVMTKITRLVKHKPMFEEEDY